MFKTNQAIFKLFWICMCLVSVNAFAQSDYRNNNEITSALKQLKSQHSSNVKLESLTKTVGGVEQL